MKQVATILLPQWRVSSLKVFSLHYCSWQTAEHQATRAVQLPPLGRLGAMTDDGALFIKPTQVFDGRRLCSDLVIRRSDDG